jgi:signal transduction histidine kinase
MSEAELRDHAEDILAAVVDDMSIAETSDEQSRKSQGRGTANTMQASGRLHADDRIQHGFPFRSVLAEFRALRATVMRLYAESGATDLAEAVRFNEAIDEALTASMDRFAVLTDQVRDQFIGILSHDLRTPLGAITAGAALLGLPDDNPQRRSWVVTRIMTSAQRMERMVGDLLDVTHVRLGGAIPLKRRPVDLQQVCDEAMIEIRVIQPDAVVRLEAGGDLRGERDPDRAGASVIESRR